MSTIREIVEKWEQDGGIRISNKKLTVVRK